MDVGVSVGVMVGNASTESCDGVSMTRTSYGLSTINTPLTRVFRTEAVLFTRSVFVAEPSAITSPVDETVVL